MNYNAGMSCGKDKGKRWRVTVLDLFSFTGAVCLALGFIRSSIMAGTGLLMLGMFVLAGSIGAFCGKLYTGQTAGALKGFWYGCWAVVGCVLGVFLLYALYAVYQISNSN